MKDENKYWEGLVSDLHKESNDLESSLSGLNRNYESDIQWSAKIKDQLSKVFLWDVFDKKEAKLRLTYRLQNNHHPIIQISRKVWFRAAVILIAMISGAIAYNLIQDVNKESRYTEVIVPLGQMTQIKLSDGSKVWLNSGSVFKYPTEFEKSERKVFIDGEAFMEVAKNKHKPFIVNTAKFSVKVLGTSFNVEAYTEDDHSSVTLVEGSVLLQSNKRKWSRNMVPGQKASIKDGRTLSISDVNTEFYSSWTEGRIVFRKEPLEDIVKKLERWYNVEICFKDEELKKLKFSGTFLKYKPVEQVFRSLSIMDSRLDFVFKDSADKKSTIQIIKRDVN